MTQQFWDTEVEVEEIIISDNKKIIVKHVTKGKNKYVDVRQYFLKGTNWQHGKGIAIPYEVAKGVGNVIVQSIVDSEEEKVFEGV